MAFHHQPVEPEKHRAIVIIGVEMDLQQVERRLRQREPGLRPQRALECPLEQIGDETRGAFGGLQSDIPRKAVGDDDIDAPARQLVALGKAVELEREIVRRLAQQRGGFLELAGALQFLGPDVEQFDPRPRRAEHGPRISRAHHRELDEVLRVALGIGAEVEHDHVLVAERGQQRGERRAVDPGHGPEGQLGHRHHRAGVARGQSAVGLALLHRIDRHAHRGRARAADRLARLLAGVDRFGRMDDGDLGAQTALAAKLGPHQLLVAVNDELERRVVPRGAGDPADHRCRAAVAAHCVNRDSRAPGHAGRGA